MGYLPPLSIAHRRNDSPICFRLLAQLIRPPFFAFLEVQLTRLFISLNIPTMGFVTAVFLGHNLALAFAVVFVMFWNFFVNRYWTYNDVG